MVHVLTHPVDHLALALSIFLTAPTMRVPCCSNQFSQDRSDASRLIVTSLVIVILACSIMYYALVVTVDILAVLKPSALDSWFFSLCKPSKRSSMGTSSPKDRRQGKKDGKTDTFEMANPMAIVRKPSSAEGAAPGPAGAGKAPSGKASPTGARRSSKMTKERSKPIVASSPSITEGGADDKKPSTAAEVAAGAGDVAVPMGTLATDAQKHMLVLSSNPLFAGGKLSKHATSVPDVVDPDDLPMQPPPDAHYQKYLAALGKLYDEVRKASVGRSGVAQCRGVNGRCRARCGVATACCVS